MAEPWEEIDNNEESSTPWAEISTNDNKTKEESDVKKQDIILKAEEMGAELFPKHYGRETKGYGIDLLKGAASTVGSVIDYAGGAPTRAGLRGLIEGGPKQGLKSFLGQYLKYPSEAPTGEQIAKENFGLSTGSEGTQPKPNWFPSSTAKAVGLGIDVLADWTNVVPVGKAVKGIAGLGGLAGNVGAKYGAKGIDVATGTNIATKTGKAVKEGTKEFVGGAQHVFSGKNAPDWPKFKEIAERNKIDVDDLPASVQHGESSFKSWSERVKGEGPQGEALRLRHEDRITDVNNAVQQEIKKISGGTRPLDNIQGGAMLRDKFDSHVNEVFDEIVETYDHVMAQNPGLMIEDAAFTKMDGIINQVKVSAARDIKRGSSNSIRSSGKQILRNIDMIEKGSGSYKQTLESLRDIGKDAFSSGNPAMVGPDKKAMQKLYFALRDGLTETADYVNPNLGQQLRLNNEKLSSLIGEKNTLAKLIRNPNTADEQLFKSTLSNSKSINALKKFYSPQEIQQIKGSFINNQLKENIKGEVSFRGAFNSLRNKKDLVNSLFDDTEELRNFTDLLLFGDRLGIPIMSTSGTGASNIFNKVVFEPGKRGVNTALETLVTPMTKKAKPPGKVKKILKKVVKSPRSKAAQVYSVQQRNEDEK